MVNSPEKRKLICARKSNRCLIRRRDRPDPNSYPARNACHMQGAAARTTPAPIDAPPGRKPGIQSAIVKIEEHRLAGEGTRGGDAGVHPMTVAMAARARQRGVDAIQGVGEPRRERQQIAPGVRRVEIESQHRRNLPVQQMVKVQPVAPASRSGKPSATRWMRARLTP